MERILRYNYNAKWSLRASSTQIRIICPQTMIDTTDHMEGADGTGIDPFLHDMRISSSHLLKLKAHFQTKLFTP